MNTEVKYVFHGSFLVLIFLLVLGGARKLFTINSNPDNSSNPINSTAGTEIKPGASSKGKLLFQANCASCHHPTKIIIGPALSGVRTRIPDQKLLHQWVHNSANVLAGGDPYFVALFRQFNKMPMNNFPELTDAEIDSIVRYVDAGYLEHAVQSPAK